MKENIYINPSSNNKSHIYCIIIFISSCFHSQLVYIKYWLPMMAFCRNHLLIYPWVIGYNCAGFFGFYFVILLRVCYINKYMNATVTYQLSDAVYGSVVLVTDILHALKTGLKKNKRQDQMCATHFIKNKIYLFGFNYY